MGMTKKYRFIRETIKSMDWHFDIEITDGKYTLWKAHIRRDDYEIFKEEEKEITKEQAEKFIAENQAHLIEVYEFESTLNRITDDEEI